MMLYKTAVSPLLIALEILQTCSKLSTLRYEIDDVHYLNILLSIGFSEISIYIFSDYKRAKQEIKRASTDTVRLQKKVRKGRFHLNMIIQNLINAANIYAFLFCCLIGLYWKRSKFITFVSCVLTHQLQNNCDVLGMVILEFQYHKCPGL